MGLTAAAGLSTAAVQTDEEEKHTHLLTFVN